MRTGLNSQGRPCCVSASHIGHLFLTPHPDFTLTPTRSIHIINRPSRSISARAATVRVLRVLRVLHSPPDGVGWHHQRQTGDDDEQAHQLLQHQPSSHAGRPAVIAPATGRHRRHRRRRRAQTAKAGTSGSRQRRTCGRQMTGDYEKWCAQMKRSSGRSAACPRWKAVTVTPVPFDNEVDLRSDILQTKFLVAGPPEITPLDDRFTFAPFTKIQTATSWSNKLPHHR